MRGYIEIGGELELKNRGVCMCVYIYTDESAKRAAKSRLPHRRMFAVTNRTRID